MVPGLSYLPEYVSAEEHDRLLTEVDRTEWRADLKRRVQHHGYRYDYKSRAVDASMRLGDLPAWAQDLALRLHGEGKMDSPPDQLIVNEYLPGQGITPHVDCVPCFGPSVVSLTLGSGCLMDFAQPKTGATESVYLAPRSLVVLRDDARYLWTHAIAGRKTDLVGGARVPRGRRVSLTFRTVLLSRARPHERA